jgi:dolichyl-diphosphooligosaccharide--protein glycosyltransferase
MAAVIWLLGLGKPDQHLVDVIGVYIPPLMAAVTVVAVFFLGKALVNKWVGLLAALMVAIMPGEFLNRSLLGYTDQHIAEVMWSSIAMLLFMLAIKQAEGMDLAYIQEKGWKGVIKPLITAVLGGIALGVFNLTWVGAPLFTLIIFIYMVIQIIVDHMMGRSPLTTGAIGVILLIVSLLVYLPAASSIFSLISIFGAVGITVVFVAASEFMSRKKVKKPLFVVAIGAFSVLVLFLMFVFTANLFVSLLDRLFSVFAWKPDTTIMEMQPLLINRGNWTFNVILGNYTSGLLLGLAGLVLVIWQMVKKPVSSYIMLVVWSLMILLAALAMRRFAYYFVVNVALLTGCFSWWILQFAGFGKEQIAAAVKPAVLRTKSARKKIAVESRQNQGRPVWMTITLAIVLLVMIYPNLGPWPKGERPSIDVATQPLFAPSNTWCETMDWLRTNTPEPLGNAEAYYAQYKSPVEKGGYVYPRNAYGVLSWWDYGYWITRIGRRIPFSNPGTSAERGEYKFFLAQDEQSAGQLMKDMYIRYVIADFEVASYDGKFHALPTWNGETYQKYYEIYIQKQNDKYMPSILFHPEYYRSMIIRLYNFEGKEVIPTAVDVIEYRMVQMQDGARYKEILDDKKFTSYAEAQQFLDSNKGKNYEIVGADPYNSPVPLEALKNYKLVYGSKDKTNAENGSNSLIKIFEYTL